MSTIPSNSFNARLPRRGVPYLMGHCAQVAWPLQLSHSDLLAHGVCSLQQAPGDRSRRGSSCCLSPTGTCPAKFKKYRINMMAVKILKKTWRAGSEMWREGSQRPEPFASTWVCCPQPSLTLPSVSSPHGRTWLCPWRQSASVQGLSA